MHNIYHVLIFRLRLEPLHLEINNWQHVLSLIYLGSVRRGKYQDFNNVLKTQKKNGGCGLKFVAKLIDEQYCKENQRMTKLEVRLIGAQAISFAQYSNRLVDSIAHDQGSGSEDIKYKALSLICQKLRDIGGLMNKVIVKENYPMDLEGLCKAYFNLFSLFFPKQCQSTVWTLGYAVPYHAKKLFENYKVGYGVFSMQGKESLHSSLKQQLRNESNRSCEEGDGEVEPDYEVKFCTHILPALSLSNGSYIPFTFPVKKTSTFR